MQGSDRDAENPLEKLTAADNREWVQLMIERGRGTTVGDIMDDSPEKLMLTEQNPDAAAAMQLHAILAAEQFPYGEDQDNQEDQNNICVSTSLMSFGLDLIVYMVA